MMFRFSLAVWGDWHIDQFVRNALPSLKAPGTLGAIDHVIAVHTRPADVERLRAALDGVNAELLAPIADDTAGDQSTANITIQGYAAQDIQAAAAAGEVWGLLAPDMVQAIVDGRQPADLTLLKLLEPWPVEWTSQRAGLLTPPSGRPC